MAVLDESQIYRDLMRFKPESLSPNAWAVNAGVSRTVWSDMRRHGNPSRRTLEKLLKAIGSSLAEFEALRLGPERAQLISGGAQLGDLNRPWGGAPLHSLPLIPSSLAGEWGEAGSHIDLIEIRPGELVDRLPRPLSLARDPDAYATTVVSDSMWPRFRPGTRVAVSPRSPVAVGDDVLVMLRSRIEDAHCGAQRALIMQLVKRTADAFELRQFNPDRTMQIEVEEVEAVLKIAGELI